MKVRTATVSKWAIVATVALLLVIGVSGRFDFPAVLTVTYATEEGKTCRGIPFIIKVCHEPMGEGVADNEDSW